MKRLLQVALLTSFFMPGIAQAGLGIVLTLGEQCVGRQPILLPSNPCIASWYVYYPGSYLVVGAPWYPLSAYYRPQISRKIVPSPVFAPQIVEHETFRWKR